MRNRTNSSIKIPFLEKRFVKSDTKDNNMLGIYIPKHAYIYLSLLSLIENKTIQTIPRLLISEWFVSMIEKTPIGQLVNIVIKLAQSDWNAYKTKLIASDFTDIKELQEQFVLFKQTLAEKLEKRNIPIDIVQIIVNKLKYETYKEESETERPKKGKSTIKKKGKRKTI